MFLWFMYFQIQNSVKNESLKFRSRQKLILILSIFRRFKFWLKSETCNFWFSTFPDSSFAKKVKLVTFDFYFRRFKFWLKSETCNFWFLAFEIDRFCIAKTKFKIDHSIDDDGFSQVVTQILLLHLHLMMMMLGWWIIVIILNELIELIIDFDLHIIIIICWL